LFTLGIYLVGVGGLLSTFLFFAIGLLRVLLFICFVLVLALYEGTGRFVCSVPMSRVLLLCLVGRR